MVKRKESGLKLNNNYFYLLLIVATKNNIFVSVADMRGKLLVQYSGGRIGMVGPRRGTPNAAELVGKKMREELSFRKKLPVILRIKGRFSNKVYSVLRGIGAKYLDVKYVQQICAVAHNGVRSKKRRRV